jgi:hypothetical protein
MVGAQKKGGAITGVFDRLFVHLLWKQVLE